MIVTTATETARTLSGTEAGIHSRSLARRGFFFSETESFDYLRLAPGAEIDSRGRRGTEEAWFVLRGSGQLLDPDGLARSLHRYTLVACTVDSGTRLRAGAQGMEVLLVAVIPDRLSMMMPVRLPVA